MLDERPFSPPAPSPWDPACCVGGCVVRAEREEKAGELSGVRGEERLAGQHESAATGAEAAQPARGPGGGGVVRRRCRSPHQRGGPAGKPRGWGREQRAWVLRL